MIFLPNFLDLFWKNHKNRRKQQKKNIFDAFALFFAFSMSF